MRARVVSSAIWFVVDVPKLIIGVAVGTTVEVAADGSLLEWLDLCWLDGSAKFWTSQWWWRWLSRGERTEQTLIS